MQQYGVVFVDPPDVEESLKRFCGNLQKFTQFQTLQERATLWYGDATTSVGFDRDGEYFAVAGVTKKIKVCAAVFSHICSCVLLHTHMYIHVSPKQVCVPLWLCTCWPVYPPLRYLSTRVLWRTLVSPTIFLCTKWAVLHNSGTIYVYDFYIHHLPVPLFGTLSCIAYNPYHKQHLVSCNYEGNVSEWDTNTGCRTTLHQVCVYLSP